MFVNFEFLKDSEVVFAMRGDLGMVGMADPTRSTGFMAATIMLKMAVAAGEANKDAAEWDHVRILDKVYPRRPENPSLPRGGPAP